MKTKKKSEIFIECLVITIGTFLYALGFQYFLYPNSIIVGGISGIAMIVNMLTNIPVGLLTIIMNVPLFLLAWKHFGTHLLVGSIAGVGLSSVFIDILAMYPVNLTNDMLLACLIGGALKGFGLGLVYIMGATTGGVDIVAKFARRRYPYINFGTIVLFMDSVIIILFAIIFDQLEGALYAVIAMFVVSKACDLVLYGTDNSNVCYIISNHSNEIIKGITETLNRGVTILEGKGAYSGEDKMVLLCVIKKPQIATVRKIIKNVDEHAFFIVTDAKNVFGKGFGDIADLS